MREDISPTHILLLHSGVFIKPKVIKSLFLCQHGLKKTPAFHELMSNCF